MNETLKLGPRGTEIIHSSESIRLKAYRDSGGVWTIGWGHTKTAKPGMEINRFEADKLFQKDVAHVEKAIRDAVKVPLTQEQFDALVSFAYNVGTGAFRGSTLLKLLNQGKYTLAADQFLRWDKDNGKTLSGLTTRRRAERRLFLEGTRE